MSIEAALEALAGDEPDLAEIIRSAQKISDASLVPETDDDDGVRIMPEEALDEAGCPPRFQPLLKLLFRDHNAKLLGWADERQCRRA